MDNFSAHECSHTATELANVFPFQEQTFQEYLGRQKGRFVLTNVVHNGNKTAVCVNIKNPTSAKWRSVEEVGPMPLVLSAPPFMTTSETSCLSSKFVKFLASHFEAIRKTLPTTAFSSVYQASLGKLVRSSTDMTIALTGLQSGASDIGLICDALALNINSPIYKTRKLKRPIQFISGSGPSEHGNRLLQDFLESVQIYDQLPELAAFGTENVRGKEKPNKRDANLRYFMEKYCSNPLGGNLRLDYVAHELKPLNIANRLRWNCKGNPRTDSIDLLMSFQSSPVITEVKMAGDSFASVALAQLLYYAAVLASKNQKCRLTRCFPQCSDKEPRLAIIVQNRDEAKEKGFHNDLDSVLRFLSFRKTGDLLGKHFGGMFVLVIDQVGDSFRIANRQEYYIDWSKQL